MSYLNARACLAAGLLLSDVAMAHADSYRYISIATGSTTEHVYIGLGHGDSSGEAINDAMEQCHKVGYPCSAPGAYNAGCLYATVGNGPDGRAYLGYGPSYASAKAKCEESGGSCPGPGHKMLNFCAVPPADASSVPTSQQSVTPTFEAPQNRPAPNPDVSRGQPGYRANEDEGPGDTGAARQIKHFLPAEGMGLFTPNKKNKSFVLCPEHDNRCYTFVDGDKPGRMVTNSQIYEAEGKFKGSRDGGAEDSGMEAFVLLNIFHTERVRYQFADLARGTTDGHYEGLICMGKNAEEHKPSPIWQTCAYVSEVRALRAARQPRFE